MLLHQDRVFGGNTPTGNSRQIAQANDERFQNRRLREREREISNIPRGIVKSRRSNMDINFPDTPPPTRFLFPESLSPLRNRLPNIAPLPSRPSIDNFAIALTRIIHDKTNTIEITPKKTTPDINKANLSGQLQEIFPNVNEVIKEDSEKSKKNPDDLNEILGE